MIELEFATSLDQLDAPSLKALWPGGHKLPCRKHTQYCPCLGQPTHSLKRTQTHTYILKQTHTFIGTDTQMKTDEQMEKLLFSIINT